MISKSHQNETTATGRTAMPAVSEAERVDLVCFSHLRWDFVYQRPQHLMNRAARGQRVFYIEEAKPGEDAPRLSVTRLASGLRVVTPILDPDLLGEPRDAIKRELLGQFFRKHNIAQYVLWYYTPAALTFTRHLMPLVTVYDCMDELSSFRNAPQALKTLEAELMQRANLVFTGGRSLYEARQGRHANIHLFPSAIEREHFVQARTWAAQPADQEWIPRPRLGFYGVIDERLDLGLLDGVAAARPNWQLVLLGPVAKIAESDLPRRPNIHYLGQKPYAELPGYLAGWNVAIMPFAMNEATRYISPTKTPEFLAGGRPVVSTPIRDVVRPYGELGLVRIAADVPEFVQAVEAALAEQDRADWLRSVDAFLAQQSWDRTWQAMARLIAGQIAISRGPRLAEARIAQARSGELLSDEFSSPLG